MSRTLPPRATDGAQSRAHGPSTGRSPAGSAVSRALHVLVTAVLGAVLALTGFAAPATAHGGDVVISLGTDGQGGISANLTWKLDGHPVEEAADVTVTAQSAAGETVGPLTLMSASEGVGWYTSDPGVLAEGNWTLTAAITTPAETTATAQVDVVPLAVPSPSAEGDAAAEGSSEDPAASGDLSGEERTAADDGATSGATGGGAGVWIAVAVVAALLLAGALVVVRRRSRASRTDETPGGKPRSLTSTSAR